VLGKPIGIALGSWLMVKSKWTTLPRHVSWKTLLACSFLGGIGFTMSVFITLLAFQNAQWIMEIKWTIICSSVIAALLGYLFLLGSLKKKEIAEEE
jgi:NhaA family Na+:H+ antiporter